VDRNLYRYIVGALLSYREDRIRLEILREYLAAPVGPDLNVPPSGGGEFIAEQDKVLYRQLQNEEFQRLEYKLKAISLFLNGLNDEDYRLIDMRYFQGLSWSAVAEAQHASEETCRKRRAPRIIISAARTLFGKLC
jgi:DNA-directed RNA polymerase specialized sigma24 family protein